MADKSTIEHLQKLARLNIDETEKEYLMLNMKNIEQFKSKLDELDTENVLPLSQIVNSSVGPRQDKVANELSSKEALKNSTNTEEGHFTVPKIK